MNYKNIKFKNTIEGFASWCSNFPSLEIGTNRQFFKKDNCYASLEKVKMFSQAPFVGATFRYYDSQQQDFVYMTKSEGAKLFDAEIRAYEKEYNIEFVRD